MGRQFWNTIREAVRIDKIKKSLTIPAATYSTFRTHGCIEYSVTDANDNRFPSSLASTAAFSAELWYKPLSAVETKQVLLIYGDATPQFEISIRVGGVSVPSITARLWIGGVPTTMTAAGNFATYSWNHVAITYDNVTFKLFSNGELIASFAVAGPTDAFLVFAHLGQSAPLTEQFVGRIAEVRVWNVARTNDQIQAFYRNPRNVGMHDVTGLVDYYKLNGVSVNGSGEEQNQVNTIQALNASSTKLTDDDTPPLIFGASFAAAEIPVSLDSPISFQFPITRPTDCNGVLVIQWITGEGTVERRKFWSLAGVDIAPDPAIYMGEQIPTPFTLEWWNVDGAETLEIPDDIVLRTSKCTNPTSSYDSTAISAATLTPDTTLGEPYPLTYPLTFNTAQTYV